MDEQNAMGGVIPATPVLYKDRSVGLVVFGILTIGLGILAALAILFIVAELVLPTVVPIPNRPSLSTLLPAIVFYGGMAVVLVWLGIGSMMARRWARALLLIFSWSWLIVGVVMLIMTAIIMPMTMAHLPATGTPGQPALPAGALDAFMVTMLLIDGVLFVVLPGIWTFFYGSRHVKATCEVDNPAPAWTDACPLPVLAVSLWFWFTVPMMLLMPFVGRPVLPFFGMFLTSWPAAILYVFLGALWGYSAWLIYRLDLRGWWLMVVALGLGAISMVLTYSHHDVMEMYRLMDYPKDQLDQLQKSGIFNGNRLLWLSIISSLPFLGYLLFIRRYFRRAS